MTAPDIKALCERLREADQWFDGKRIFEVRQGCSIEHAQWLVKLKGRSQEAATALSTAYACGLEDAAKVCENAYGPWDETKDAATNMAWNRREMAQAIRAKIKEAG